MKPKLFIINNGLKDLRGHYFETSVSIAEASESMGLHPILAAHVNCPTDLAPEGLEFHPAFTTDHWMIDAPPPPPDSNGLRGDPARLPGNSIQELKAGKISFEDYLAARFVSSIATMPREDTPPVAPPPSPIARAKTISKKLLRPWVPPAIVKARHFVKPVLRHMAPPILWKCARMLLAPRPEPQTAPEQPLPLIYPLTPFSRLEATLQKLDLSHELEYMNRFRTDLEYLFFLAECSANDHVFLPTAHGRELAAILEMASHWPLQSRPTFHLEFRHALELDNDGMISERDPYSRAHRAFFQFARSFPPNERIRLYTDSEGLSRDYQHVSGLEFGVLPIPFRSKFIDTQIRDRKPLQIGYFGDVRDEKGFHWLPEVIDSMMDDHVRSGRVRFLIQASLIHPGFEPRSSQAIERLKAFSPDIVRLVGLSGPLTPESYYQLVSQTDLLLCPYDPRTYKNRTSGTLAEAIAAGAPTVVPHGSWLSRQQPSGSGETFTDLDSFIAAVKRVCDDYPRYHAHALGGRHAWLSLHSPDGLIQSLLKVQDADRSHAGKVA